MWRLLRRSDLIDCVGERLQSWVWRWNITRRSHANASDQLPFDRGRNCVLGIWVEQFVTQGKCLSLFSLCLSFSFCLSLSSFFLSVSLFLFSLSLFEAEEGKATSAQESDLARTMHSRLKRIASMHDEILEDLDRTVKLAAGKH